MLRRDEICEMKFESCKPPKGIKIVQQKIYKEFPIIYILLYSFSLNDSYVLFER